MCDAWREGNKKNIWFILIGRTVECTTVVVGGLLACADLEADAEEVQRLLSIMGGSS